MVKTNFLETFHNVTDVDQSADAHKDTTQLDTTALSAIKETKLTQSTIRDVSEQIVNKMALPVQTKFLELKPTVTDVDQSVGVHPNMTLLDTTVFRAIMEKLLTQLTTKDVLDVNAVLNLFLVQDKPVIIA